MIESVIAQEHDSVALVFLIGVIFGVSVTLIAI